MKANMHFCTHLKHNLHVTCAQLVKYLLEQKMFQAKLEK
jgi:hypothetical protein